jgi:hypothetical protein
MQLSSRTFRTLTLGVALSALAAAPALAQKVNTDYNHSINFTQFHTFSFGQVHGSDELFTDRIRTEIARDLTARGWQQVPNGGDVIVTAIGGMKDQQEYNTFYTGFGPGWGWRRGWGGGGFGDTMTTVNEVPVGTLIVDLYEGQSKQLLFRGTATDELSTKSEKNTAKLDKAIDKIFNKFPRKSQG